MTDSLEKLQQVLGHQFQEISYLQQALTHRSIGATNNERLEFLGDSVLNFCITRKLYELSPEATEGELSRIRASLVNKEVLASIADGLQLSRYLRLGRGEKLDEILASQREVVEGVRTTPAAARLAENHGVEMPITDAMTRLLTGQVDPKTALRELMTRELRVEAEL